MSCGFHSSIILTREYRAHQRNYYKYTKTDNEDNFSRHLCYLDCNIIC